MKDTIYRDDAINSIYKLKKTVIKHDVLSYRDGISDALEIVQDLPSADRPSGEVDAVKEYERQVHNLEQGYITLGEFDKRVEPLRHLYYDRPSGEWIHNPNGIDRNFIWWKCSECGHVIYSESEHDREEFHAFCGRCGARMKGADDED